MGAINAVAAIFEHLGLEQEADWVRTAVQNALEMENTTVDLGGRLSTSQTGDFINQLEISQADLVIFSSGHLMFYKKKGLSV